MLKGEYKKVLFEIFEVLGFYEKEKEMALEGFKKKFSTEMLLKIENALTQDQRQWLAQTITNKEYDKQDPKISEIQQTIDTAIEKEELDKISRSVFKNILLSYTAFMSSRIDSEKGEKFRQIAEGF